MSLFLTIQKCNLIGGADEVMPDAATFFHVIAAVMDGGTACPGADSKQRAAGISGGRRWGCDP